jgi:uncharacterized surface protein with fasciclin (FAS1) repeats
LSASIFTSCKKDDETAVIPLKDVSAVLVANPQFSTLVTALTEANLVTDLKGTGPFTVFAPNNAAFAKAGITNLDSLSNTSLTPILSSHVLSGTVKAADMKSGTAKTGNSKNDIYLSKNSDGIFINGKIKVLATDVTASNGVIHVIDNVIVPPVDDFVLYTIVENPDFSEFWFLIQNSGDGIPDEPNIPGSFLVSHSDSDGVTVFAPTNAAFNEFYKTFPKSALLSNKPLLRKILLYHYVSGRMFSTDLPNLGMAEVSTISNADYSYSGSGKLSFNLEGGLKVKGTSSGNSNITTANILAKNGVVHVIDKVLVPEL